MSLQIYNTSTKNINNEISNNAIGNFEHLPNELIFEIIKYLNNDFNSLKNLKDTSRYFRHIIYNSGLKNTIFFINNKFMNFLNHLNKFNNVNIVNKKPSGESLGKFKESFFLKMINLKFIDLTVKDNLAIKIACANGLTDVVKLLLADERFDPKVFFHSGRPFLWKNVEVVKLFLTDKKINPAAFFNMAIRMAAWDGHTKVVKLLLADKRVDPAAIENEAIRMAAWNGHTKVVKLLLADKRVDPAAIENEAIRMASCFGHTEVVKLLLKEGRVNPSAKENEAIRRASANEKKEVVQLLKNHEIMIKWTLPLKIIMQLKKPLSNSLHKLLNFCLIIRKLILQLKYLNNWNSFCK